MAKNESEGGGGRAQAVHRVLKRAILDQALSPGSKLPEDSIGERLGVSRTLVREALVRLSQEGLVELRPNRGAMVARPTLEEARNLFLTRMALERLVVETLSGKLTPDQIDALSTHISAEEAAKKEQAPSIRLAGEFHTLLAQMTNNTSLIRYVNELVARSSLILALYGRPHSSECAVSEHRELLDNLIAGKTDEATALMAHHLESVTTRALLPADGDRNIKEVLSAYAAAEGLA
ncbi:GntR family transcriptional regulator [Ensifer sp. 4252]|uniref:GntR family transcriptional regulator n=1 Tax=Ensifer sp. 4252 TaxID=3373915 RepID=UPI003D1E7416